jgi:hypothetical protein
MKKTAAGLAALGRNGDSTLVHMNPSEVAGLQAFAKANGTSLTVNPHTGLPEAFNLKALLPAVAGIGLTALSGGTLSPLMAGLIVGGVHGAATGFQNPMQSLMAGVGGAGGAGLGGAMGLGSAAAAPTAETAFTPAAESVATGAAAEGAASQAAAPWTSGFDVPSMETPIATQSAAPVVEAGRPASMMDKLRVGMTERGAMDTKTGLMLAAAPAAGSMMEPEQMGGTKPISTIRPYSFNREVTPGAFDDLTDSRERRYFNDQFTAGEPYQLARGGLATFVRGGKTKKFDPLEQRYEMADFRDPQSMQKKTMGMYQYAAGGKTLRGDGDGMSDDIKANIDGVQEARLSDGEFVIPADVVSGLGNGSTEAGSKQLKAMMDRVRQQRTGRKQQARQIKVKGLMPA